MCLGLSLDGIDEIQQQLLSHVFLAESPEPFHLFRALCIVLAAIISRLVGGRNSDGVVILHLALSTDRRPGSPAAP